MGRFTIKLSYNGSFSKYLSYLILLISLFLAFFSYNKSSFGVECILFTIAILLLNFRIKNLLELLPFIVICGTTTLLYSLSGQTEVRGFNAPVNHMLKFVYLMFVVALSIGMRELPKEAKAKIIKCTLFSVLISVMISSYNAIFVDRYAIRYQDSLGFNNVVDFAQFYGICLIFCAMVFVLLRYRKSYSVWKHWLYCIPLIVCIGLSLYVTGVLITALGIGLGFALYKYDQSKTKAALWVVIVIVIVLLMIVFSAQISDWIYKVTEPLNWILKDRLRNVADRIFKTNHNLIYTYSRRDELAGYSLKSFHRHPFFGVGYKEYGYGVIGGHQEWQDFLGVFGLVGIVIFSISVIFLVRITAKYIDNKTDFHAFCLCVILFIILGFLNPCLNLPVLAAVFVIAPNISLIIPWWKDEEQIKKNLHE